MAGVVMTHVREGERLSWWKAFAWYDPARAMAVCYPFPLNLLMRGLRNCWMFAVAGRLSRWDEQCLDAEGRARQSVMQYASRLHDEAVRLNRETREMERQRQRFVAEYGELLRLQNNMLQWAKQAHRVPDVGALVTESASTEQAEST